ncbi:SDR family NAD(P)-dependent oxidoreductase [Gracilibacillus sp. S3-1-1]|uniref:SDR family NAD(P)-dependent oxidoreductase n=1 Tax=Gracilibacillus pellucidus TaxID=3095368 RepID=A0ACC6M8E3_9BACI|nr:SDR family NAD(P)-dependent oxidoreductase [Gracilibacillus sp. S3-1-1]MDX8047239.1 SDR family NAD(P)-dependent oxidoreductase [Gracilibacillus sp. S3-1-1]
MHKNTGDIAIVGMACHFPDAINYNQFWNNIQNGVQSVKDIPQKKWDNEQFYSDDINTPNKMNIRKMATIEGGDLFDHNFFNISPREAKNMDPQQRILLEESWHCIEDSGISLELLQKAVTSVFVGVINTEYRHIVTENGADIDSYMNLGTFESVLANRISHIFNFSGASMPVNSACAASLVAVHDAMRSLRLGDSDYSLVGGVNVALDPGRYISYSKARMLSPDGKCKTFDKDANGFVPGEGVGVLLLQRLEDAQSEGNYIYGVLKGSNVNHSGKTASITAPSVAAQKKLISGAYADAKISPDTVSYIETHGTGTTLGDPIEMEALIQLFQQYTNRKQYCNVGSVKTNIGHLESASGIAGLIKVLMMMRYRKIAPTLNCNQLNPIINFESSPFCLANELVDWQPTQEQLPLRAGVSSFGFSGVNCHVLVEEYTHHETPKVTEKDDEIFILSAKTAKSLEGQIEEWQSFVEEDIFKNNYLKDICATLQTGRGAYPYRYGVQISSKDELKSYLKNVTFSNVEDKPWNLCIGEADLTGYSEEIEKLINGNHMFNKHLTHVLSLVDNKEFWNKHWGNEYRSQYSFAVYYAYVQTLMELGFIPDLISSKQSGIWVSLAISNILKLEDVLDVLSGKKGEEKVAFYRPTMPFYDSVHKKVILPWYFNEDYLLQLQSRLFEDENLYLNYVPTYIEKARLLLTSQFTFKRYIEEWNELTKKELGLDIILFLYDDSLLDVTSKEKGIKRLLLMIIMSSLNKLNLKWGLSEKKQFEHDAFYELLHLIIDGVLTKQRFLQFLMGSNTHDKEIAESLNQRQNNLNREREYPLAKALNQNITEVGNVSKWLLSAINETNIHVVKEDMNNIVLKSHNNDRTYDSVSYGISLDMKSTLLQLWQKGVNIEWNILYEQETFRKVPLPVYNYTRRSFWPSNENKSVPQPINTVTPNEEHSVMTYHQTVWKETDLKAEMSPDKFKGTLLLFDDQTELFDMLDNQLKSNSEAQTILVQPGTKFMDKGSNKYEINPIQQEDYTKLFNQLKQRNLIPFTFVHHTSHTKSFAEENILRQQLYYGFYSLYYMTQAFMKCKLDKITLLTLAAKNTSHPQPQHEALSSYIKTIQQENPSYTCKYVQIDSSYEQPDWSKVIWNELFIAGDTANDIQYTSNKRYIKRLEEVEVDNQRTSQIQLHTDGAYIITGGLGGLGLIIAEHLAKQSSVSLVLTGRSPLDKAKENQINKIKKLCTNVTYIQVDVSDKSDVSMLIKQVKKQFNCIRGIIHSAGVHKSGIIMHKTIDEIEEVLAPKVWGTFYLDEYTKDEPLDFFVMFSSIVSVVGEVGLSDYAYANSFMDHYTKWREMHRQKQQRSGKTLSISWPIWEKGGIQLSKVINKQFFEQTGLNPLPAQKGIQFFNNLTFNVATLSHCLVGYGDKNKVQYFLDKHFGQEKVLVQEEQQEQNELVDLELLYEKTAYLFKTIIAEELGGAVEEIDLEVTFEEYGIDSIMIHHFNARLESEFGSISKTLFFEYRCLKDLIDYFVQNNVQLLVTHFGLNLEDSSVNIEQQQLVVNSKLQNDKASEAQIQKAEYDEKTNIPIKRKYQIDDIAIVGVAGRYPGANNLDEFWDNLVTGKGCVTEIPISRWDYRDYYDPNPDKADEGKIYCKWGGFLENIDFFDPLLFNISPREAESMDPQERLWLQTVWSTLEDAGYTRDQLRKYVAHKDQADIGVFVGVTTNSYQLIGLESWRDGDNRLPHSLPWSLANRVSYIFNFNGPSMPVDTACSSSLTAIHLACESLRKGEASVAVAGGVNLLLHPMEYAFRCQKRMLSPTGRCHSFGEEGDGYVPGEGVGAILLKPLHDAVADGDQIYAVIKGTAINHGGRTNGYTVPNPKAQADVITQALKKSNVDPQEISYIEAHGTGTSLGDPIEINGLTQAFNSYRGLKQYCSVGSVKSNIGHLEAAAGISGLTKILLQMKYKQLVPSLHAEKINPNINLQDTPFYVQKHFTKWKQPVITQGNENKICPRIAGISSFGAGGANAHVILEEYSVPDSNLLNKDNKPSSYVIALSSQNEDRLKENVKSLYQFLARDLENVPHAIDKENLIHRIEQDLLDIIAEILKMSKESFPESDFGDYFVDPLHLKQLADRINEEFEFEISPSLFSEFNVLTDLAEYLYNEYKNKLQSYYRDSSLHNKKVKIADRLSLSDVAYTLQVGREEMDERFAVVVSDMEDLMGTLYDFYNGHTLPNVYTGNVQRDKDRFSLFTKGRAGQEFLKMLVQDNEWDQLAPLWASGVNINWNLLYSKHQPKRVSLPSYPFAQESYWLRNQKSHSPNQVQKLHPLLDQNLSNFYEQRFSTQLQKDKFYVSDHLIMGENVFPAAAMLEMARAAGEFAGDRKVHKITKVVWPERITVGQEDQNIYIGLRTNEGGADFTITSSERNNSDHLHSEGRVEFSEGNGLSTEIIDLKAISNRCTQKISKQLYYNRLKEIGLQYGPCFQAIQSVSYGKNEVIAHLFLPEELSNNPETSLESFLLHPSLVDGALQSSLVLINEAMIDHTVLPFAIGEMTIIRPLKEECFAYATLHEKQPGNGIYRMNVNITDQQGQILVKVKDFTLRISRQGVNKREEVLKLFQSLERNEIDIADVERLVGGYYEKSYTFE